MSDRNDTSNNSLEMADHESMWAIKLYFSRVLDFPISMFKGGESLWAVERVAEGPLHPAVPTPLPPYSLEVVAYRLLWPVDPVVVAPSEDLVAVILSIFIIYSDKNRQ